MRTRYEAYTIDTPLKEAVARYTKKVGVPPTKILVPEHVEIVDAEELELIVTRRVSCLMLTHQPIDLPLGAGAGAVARDRDFRPRRAKDDYHTEKDKEGVYLNDVLRPYNQLGFYPGWARGIDPPYWKSLRRYVFNRDGGVCSNCKARFKYKNLHAHHIVMKEAGGVDGARNLITLCKSCHDKVHDFYDHLIERGLCPADVAMLPVEGVAGYENRSPSVDMSEA